MDWAFAGVLEFITKYDQVAWSVIGLQDLWCVFAWATHISSFRESKLQNPLVGQASLTDELPWCRNDASNQNCYLFALSEIGTMKLYI